MASQTSTISSKISLVSDTFDVDKFRSLVPVLAQEDILYFNASYQPPMNLKVRRAIDQYLDDAVYQPNPKPTWQAATEKTRALVGRYINAPTDCIAFTSDTTEGLNLFQRSLNFKKGENVVILDTEHPNQAYGWLALQEAGLEVRQVCTEGKLYADASTFAPLVDENTKAIGISSIMFHSGQKNNVKDICDKYRPRGIHVLLDMTQEVGVGPVDVTKTGVSAACFSFHKAFGCPTGLGGFYIHPEVLAQIKQTPPIVGAGAISNLRPDLMAMAGPVECHKTARRFEHLNLSIISIRAAHAALTFLMEEMTPEGVEAHLRSLGRRLKEECRILGIEIVGEEDESKRAPHLYVLKLKDPAWQQHFSKNSVYVSCYRLGVRVSLGFYNKETDIERFGKVLKDGLESGIPCL